MTGNLSTYLAGILPELSLVILAVILLVVDVATKENRKNLFAYLTALGMLVALIIMVSTHQLGGEPSLIWGGLIKLDGVGFVFGILFLTAAMLTSLFTIDTDRLKRQGEFYVLLTVSTLGMLLMSKANNILMLYLSIELTSIPLYVLAGFKRDDTKSAEAGIKYFLFGAATSTIMLFGFSLLFGFTGETQLSSVLAAVSGGMLPLPLLLLSLLLILVGVGFKISAFPFHFWAPDVYEGAPTVIAGYLSTASKAAGFAVLIRILFEVYPAIYVNWSLVLGVMSAASMFIGNFLALVQKNIKRLLAYSSISHAGYILIGVAAASSFGVSASVYYLIAYFLTNIAAFALVSMVSKETGSYEIASYAGLSRRAPGISLLLLVVFLSLAGIPPFAGFISKFFVFAAAIEANMIWLGILGILNAVVALSYYLNVLKVIYLYRSEHEGTQLSFDMTKTTLVSICVIGVIIVGFVIAPFFSASSAAAIAFLGL